MFKIRRIFDDVLPADKAALNQVQNIMRTQFSEVKKEEIDNLPAKLRNPFIQRFRSVLMIAESAHGKVMGFAFLLYDPVLKFCFLDYIASAPQTTSRGIGGALYEHVRDEAKVLNLLGIFFECLPDLIAKCSDVRFLKENSARLRFYEKYGARPIANTEYDRPINPNDLDMPFLVFDALDSATLPRQDYLKSVVKAILERKYGDLCSPVYIKAVIDSIKDDPIKLRDFRYIKKPQIERRCLIIKRKKALLVFNKEHEIHHVKERGYVEAPVRVCRH